MSDKVFKYSAMDAQGKEKTGVIDATNENDANSKLKQMGLFPTSICKMGTSKKEKVRDKKKNTLEDKMDILGKLPVEEVERKIIFQFRIFGFIFTLERAY